VNSTSSASRYSNGTRFLACLLAFNLMGLAGCNMVATGQNMQGAQLYEKGQYYQAMEKFQQAMASDPTDADAYYNMASTMQQLGTTNKDPNMLQQAETLYNQCLDRNPNHADCHRALAVLLVQTDRSDRAFNLLKNWAIRSPQSADARVELARLYEEFGDTKTAELQLQQALQIDQNNPRAWTAMAYLRESKGDTQQALANYQRAYALDGYNPALASRIAALNQSTSQANWGNVSPVLPDNATTRTVDASSSSVAAPRY
jgi:tetratricopeptide (TPR) repeat protein